MDVKVLILSLVVSMASASAVGEVALPASGKSPVIAAGLWEVTALHQSIAFQGEADIQPLLTRNSRHYLVCRDEKRLQLKISPAENPIRGVVANEHPSAVALLFFDEHPPDRGGRMQTLMEIYRGDFAREFTVTTVIDDLRSYLPKASAAPVPMFSRTLERFTRIGDCPADMKRGDYRDLPSP